LIRFYQIIAHPYKSLRVLIVLFFLLDQKETKSQDKNMLPPAFKKN
jgi:hypothetical protein